MGAAREARAETVTAHRALEAARLLVHAQGGVADQLRGRVVQYRRCRPSRLVEHQCRHLEWRPLDLYEHALLAVRHERRPALVDQVSLEVTERRRMKDLKV